MMKVFLWVLREGGARNVPSFDGLRKLQKKLRSECGVPSKQYESCQGNIFFVNDPRTLIAQVKILIIGGAVRHQIKDFYFQDYANPLIRPHLHLYPEIPDGPITEVWHAKKWRKGLDPVTLAPMYDDKHGRHYYINELAHMQDGEYVIPVRWVKQQGRMYADAFRVKLTDFESESDKVWFLLYSVCTY